MKKFINKKSKIFATILLTFLFSCGGETEGTPEENEQGSSTQVNLSFKSSSEIFDGLKKGEKLLKIIGCDSDNPIISENQKKVLRNIDFDSLDNVFNQQKHKDTLAESQVEKVDIGYRDLSNKVILHNGKPFTGYYFDSYEKGLVSTLWGQKYILKSDLLKYKPNNDRYNSCPKDSVPEILNSRILGYAKFGREIQYNKLYNCDGNRVKKGASVNNPCSNSWNNAALNLTIIEHDYNATSEISLVISDDVNEKLKSFNYEINQEQFSTEELIKSRDKNNVMNVTNRIFGLYHVGLYHGPQYALYKDDTVGLEKYFLNKRHGIFYCNMREYYKMSSGFDYWRKCEFNHGDLVYKAGIVIDYYKKDPTSVNGDTNFYKSSNFSRTITFCSPEANEYDVFYLAKNPKYDPQVDRKREEFKEHGVYRKMVGNKLNEKKIYNMGMIMYDAEVFRKDGSVLAYKKWRNVWKQKEKYSDSVRVIQEDYYQYNSSKWGSNDYFNKYDENENLIFKRSGKDVYEYEYDEEDNLIKETKNGTRVG
jgi:hypothetical protein